MAAAATRLLPASPHVRRDSLPSFFWTKVRHDWSLFLFYDQLPAPALPRSPSRERGSSKGCGGIDIDVPPPPPPAIRTTQGRRMDGSARHVAVGTWQDSGFWGRGKGGGRGGGQGRAFNGVPAVQSPRRQWSMVTRPARSDAVCDVDPAAGLEEACSQSALGSR